MGDKITMELRRQLDRSPHRLVIVNLGELGQRAREARELATQDP